MNQRIGKAERRSSETSVKVEINLEGQGLARIDTGIGFFDHMLTILAGHSGFDLLVECRGDLNVDGHHTVEDVGIVLGRAFAQALGDKKGISRYGTSFVPMDESLAMVSLDISGRPYLHYETPQLALMVGSFDTQLAEEFFRAFCNQCGITLHVRILYGSNAHHMLEAAFKAFARALRQAVALEKDVDKIPSTKGIID
ncbi:MAG: imidazoleglycerol-phosphate dehydratase HisB [Caldicoprobacter oshimai]|uniref:Imidazoleglycerol-phosphate dehydratase n=1 Tax=Caldicoprobacter faecalis TaxID=937334 RepID=A0A1I5RVI1_9FIRM|nr:imidazoleglycerol-phosphate dehydratase HisB [Caldicoprobacter faecalis]PZN12183.1 MAG: imidazoleglycerol-phosphate dehydratase HisB [Caldicoprobacter oshimai]SFP62562.1 imidazoleglycerol-phosphate dehydratase [Caldicoprobacter faecalis]